jgi:hypothetical protein
VTFSVDANWRSCCPISGTNCCVFAHPGPSTSRYSSRVSTWRCLAFRPSAARTGQRAACPRLWRPGCARRHGDVARGVHRRLGRTAEREVAQLVVDEPIGKQREVPAVGDGRASRLRGQVAEQLALPGVGVAERDGDAQPRPRQARRRDRARPRPSPLADRRSHPDRGGRYARHRLTITPGPPSRSSTTRGTSSFSRGK